MTALALQLQDQMEHGDAFDERMSLPAVAG